MVRPWVAAVVVLVVAWGVVLVSMEAGNDALSLRTMSLIWAALGACAAVAATLWSAPALPWRHGLVVGVVFALPLLAMFTGLVAWAEGCDGPPCHALAFAYVLRGAWPSLLMLLVLSAAGSQAAARLGARPRRELPGNGSV